MDRLCAAAPRVDPALSGGRATARHLQQLPGTCMGAYCWSMLAVGILDLGSAAHVLSESPAAILSRPHRLL